MHDPERSMLAAVTDYSRGFRSAVIAALRRSRQPGDIWQEVAMHWSRELLALTAGVRWRIAGLVAIGLLIVVASLASLVCAGRAIAAMFAGQSLIDF